mgnify:CR=1 FL=1
MTKRSITVAAIQTSYGNDIKDNIARTEGFVREAAKAGAQVVLPSELFQGIYFCTEQDPKWFKTAYATGEHPCVIAMQKLAKKHKVAIPTSFFEKDGPRYYNSLAMVDADGEILGVYRKSHIPDGPGYQEKYYFRPGDTGFRAWKTRYGTIGISLFQSFGIARMLEGISGQDGAAGMSSKRGGVEGRGGVVRFGMVGSTGP